MLALLLCFAVLPQPHLLEQIPVVESIELNYVLRPIKDSSDDWWTKGWERSLSQAILRDVDPLTGRLEIRAWSGFGTEDIPIRYERGWYWLQTSQGLVRTRVVFTTYTDYDVEREEAYERCGVEHRAGWPR